MSTAMYLGPSAPRRRTGLGLGLGLSGGLLGLWLGFGAACERAAASPRKGDTKAAPVARPDAAVLAQLAGFLRDYRGALVAKDARFLTEHTAFPLPFAESVYDMEAKARRGTLASVEELLKARDVVLWPEALAAGDGAQLVKLQRGVQKCGDPKAPEVPDWRQGGPAIELRGGEATLTYLASPCESETHRVTLHFARAEKTWRLRERSVRMGAR
ncbi:MAG: hypothetical protein U1A78_17945 [Polyangia bacterium]